MGEDLSMNGTASGGLCLCRESTVGSAGCPIHQQPPRQPAPTWTWTEEHIPELLERYRRALERIRDIRDQYPWSAHDAANTCVELAREALEEKP